jgi:protease I
MAESTVICLLGQGFEDSEFRVPYDRLRAAGAKVDVVGVKPGEELKGYRGKETVRADRGIDDVRPDQYGALFIPGGYSPDHLRADDRFVAFVKAFEATGHPIAAVCHGPQLLISAELVRGRTLTAWKTIQGDLRQMGATVKDAPVVIDRNWITSRQPSDLDMFSQALLRALGVSAERAPQQTAASENEPNREVEAEEELPSRRPGERPKDQQPGMSAEQGIETETQRLRREVPADKQKRADQPPSGKKA